MIEDEGQKMAEEILLDINNDSESSRRRSPGGAYTYGTLWVSELCKSGEIVGIVLSG